MLIHYFKNNPINNYKKYKIVNFSIIYISKKKKKNKNGI